MITNKNEIMGITKKAVKVIDPMCHTNTDTSKTHTMKEVTVAVTVITNTPCKILKTRTSAANPRTINSETKAHRNSYFKNFSSLSP